MFNTVWHEIFEGLAILCLLWELILAIRTEGFFLQRIDFCDFQAMDIHIFKQYYGVRTLCKTSKTDSFSLSFDYEHEQTRFLSSAFLCSELKLENIHSGVNFWGKMFAVIFLRIAGKIAQIAKISTGKNSCLSVGHSFFCPAINHLAA